LYLLPASAKISLIFSTSVFANASKVGIPLFTSNSPIFGPIPSIFLRSSGFTSAAAASTLGASTLASSFLGVSVFAYRLC